MNNAEYRASFSSFAHGFLEIQQVNNILICR
jgi:hypothetical protein